MDNNKKALKSGIWYTFANFAMSALTFLTTPIFTRMLTKADFGTYSAYSSCVQILSIIVPLNFAATLICAKYDYPDDYKGYAFSCMSFSVILSAFWCVVFNLFSDFFVGLFGLQIEYINILTAYVCFLPAVNIFLAAERCLFEYKKAVVVAVSQAVATALLSILLVVVMGNKLTGRIIGSALPTVLIGLALMIFYAVKTKHISFGYLPYALKICLPYVPHTLSLVILNSVDRIMIKNIRGPEETALYSLAYTCALVITVLIAAMNDAFVPWLAEKINQEKYQEIKAFSQKYISLFGLLVTAMMLLAPEILFVLGGKDYSEAVYAIPPVMAGCVCQFIYSMYVNIEQIKKKTVGMACASVIAAVLNYILNLIFIPKYGYIAAAYTTLAGYFALVVMHMLLVRKMNMDHIYSTGAVILFLLGTLGMTALNSFLYLHSLVRYSVAVIYFVALALIFIKNKDKIIKLFNVLLKRD